MRLSYKLLFLALCFPLFVHAQIGEHRNTLSIGGNAGYNLTNIRFTPKVVQNMKGGMSFGFTARYTVEKYFSTIASVQAEVNFSQMGWKENILNTSDQPVINAVTGQAEKYERTINYIQIPFWLTSPGDVRTKASTSLSMPVRSLACILMRVRRPTSTGISLT